MGFMLIGALIIIAWFLIKYLNRLFLLADALIKASQKGKLDAVLALLEAGTSPNLSNKYAITALMMASHCGHTAVVRTLLDYGSNPNLTDYAGKTALIYASDPEIIYSMLNGPSCFSEIIKLLLVAGADTDIQSKKGQTALMEASREGYTEIVKILLLAKANINLKNMYGLTALDIATLNKNHDIRDLLLEAIDKERYKETG